MVAPRLSAVSCLLASLFTSAITVAAAEPLTLHLADPAQKYAIDVVYPQAPTQTFDDAPATITLRDKASGAVLQRIESAEAFALFKPGSNELAADQNLLLFGDFNFDGEQDLAVRNGNYGGYAEPSYDIYLSDPESPTLVLSKAFSALTREPNLGLFGVDAASQRLITHSKSGCCWRQTGTWQIQDNQPLMIAETIKVAQRPLEATPLMPRGYTDITQRDLDNGQWAERNHLEGPEATAPMMVRGTLNGKIAFELWWQVQGAAYVGEVRYPKSGSGQPIRLIGGPYEDGAVLLHELNEAGETTGDWYVQGEPNLHGVQDVSWHGPAEKILSGTGRPTVFKVAATALLPVVASQREGRYLVNNAEEPRTGELILKILPSTDASGVELADIHMSIRISKDRVWELNKKLPLQAGNLVIGMDDKNDFSYRLQLLNGAIQFQAYGDIYEFSSVFVKQNP